MTLPFDPRRESTSAPEEAELLAATAEAIVEATAPLTGQEFLDELVEQLGRALGVRHLFVGELLGRSSRVRTLALATDGRRATGFDYDLHGTPCAQVVDNRPCFIEANAAGRYPDDLLLAEMGIESYFGCPLVDETRTPIGLVAALHVLPMPSNRAARTLLRLFAGRIGAEVMRLRHDRERAVRLRYEAVGALASGIAHDFNNVLVAVLGNAQLARDLVSGEATELVDDILAAGRHGQALVAEIRDYAGIGDGRRDEDVDLVALLDEVARAVAPKDERRGRLIVESEADTPRVHGSRLELARAYGNLVRNALQATERATGTVWLHAREATVSDLGHLDAQVRRRYAVLEVTDDGDGIPPEVRPRLFEPFFTTRKGQGGTGLGLAIVQRAVAAHGGHLALRSTPGVGTTFLMFLPA